MADTRNDVAVPKATWVNLYTLSGITVGTACTVVNKGSSNFNIVIGASQPTINTKGFPVFTAGTGSMVNIPSGASGLWAYSADGSTTVLVQE